jgi:hypothetical protein
MSDRKPLLAAAAVALLLGGALAAASLRGEPRRRLRYDVDDERSLKVAPAALATWIVEGRRDFAVVDLRDHKEFEKGHVRGAVSCGSCHSSREDGQRAQQGEGFVDLSKKLVLYTDSDLETITLPKALHDNPNLYRLRGGWQGWQRDVLTKRAPDGLSSEAALEAARRHEAVRAFLTGERPSQATEAKLPVAPIKRSGEHKPAGPSEGC